MLHVGPSLSSHFLLLPFIRNMNASQVHFKSFFQTKPLFNHLSLKENGLQSRATQREAKEGRSPVRNAVLPSILASLVSLGSVTNGTMAFFSGNNWKCWKFQSCDLRTHLFFVFIAWASVFVPFKARFTAVMHVVPLGIFHKQAFGDQQYNGVIPATQTHSIVRHRVDFRSHPFCINKVPATLLPACSQSAVGDLIDWLLSGSTGAKRWANLPESEAGNQTTADLTGLLQKSLRAAMAVERLTARDTDGAHKAPGSPF